MSAFTLKMFQSELDKIQRYVLAYPNIETGGDLFGLWSNSGDPVVQLLIGPGKNCRRTSVSFHQDIDYLQEVGTFLNTSFMLCHIGSWHSHHQLSLTQPSAGDRSTVCNNWPRGRQRYIMIIANIVTSSTRTAAKSVHIHPYMFTSKGRVCKRGTVQRISRTSPYMEYGYVMNKLNEGAERSRRLSKFDYDLPIEVKSLVKDRRFPAKSKASSLYKTSEDIRPTTAGQRNGYREKSVVYQWYNSSKDDAKLQKIHGDIRVKRNPSGAVEFSARLQNNRTSLGNHYDAGKSRDSFRARSQSARLEWRRYESRAEKPSEAVVPWQRTASKSALKTSQNPGRSIPSNYPYLAATPNSRNRKISSEFTVRIDSGYVRDSFRVKTTLKNDQQRYSRHDSEKKRLESVTSVYNSTKRPSTCLGIRIQKSSF